ncbi:MAG: AAA family ATPase, partial [Chloroflexi bacterium]|nr:AAA family ATPase [Chloroflexota bacterium]
MQVVATRPNIVGRQSEIDALESAINSAQDGNGRTIGLFGEPGIGKTVLVSLASESAERQGFKVIRGYCREHGGAPAYWPWIELIRGLLSGRSDDEAKRLLGENIGWLAQISPDAAKFSSSPGSKETNRSASSPEEFRFQLFDAFSRTLRSASEAEPLLLIIEDIHWADESSLYLLELLASSVGESPIAFIFTSRDFEMADNPTALSRTIGELARWDVFSKIDLKRLSLEATAEQVASLGGDGGNSGLRDAIFASSEGNPLFTAELIRLLTQQGKLESATADDVGVSGGVSEVITRRLSDFDENELDLIQTCSVIGQEIEIGLLASVAETSAEQLLIDLEGPISSQILRFEGSNLHFTHALVGETVSKGLSAPELVRRNAKVAEALIEFAGENMRPYIQRLAVHYVASQAITGIDRAVEYSLLAGEEALRLVEFAPARHHFQRVLELTSNQEINSIRAQALGGMWKISSRTAHESEISGLVHLLAESFDFFMANGKTSSAVELASWSTTPYVSARGVDNVIGRAIELVKPDSHDAGRLFARKIATAYMERRAMNEAEYNFERAVEIARVYEDTELELSAISAMLSSYGHSESGMTDESRNTRGSQSLVLRGIELANDSSNLFFESVLLFRAIAWYVHAGDMQSAWAHMRRARDIDGV